MLVKLVLILNVCISVHVNNEAYLAENLEKLGTNALNRENESDIGRFETSRLETVCFTPRFNVILKHTF